VAAPGDAELEGLWHGWHRHVLAYAIRRADSATAEDVVSETFAIAWRRLGDVPERPLPWLLAVARRVLANKRRGERRRAALVERLRHEGAAAQGPPDARAERALAALAGLSERDQETLLLHAWDGLDHGEAGTVMGCSAATFAVRLHRARRRFEQELETVDEAATQVAP
jgi:RNA polymerase sigma factor (sigma-70 family)